jgi:hypothetical protein
MMLCPPVVNVLEECWVIDLNLGGEKGNRHMRNLRAQRLRLGSVQLL